MFQEYAVTYRLEGHSKGFGTTTLVDLDEAKALGREEMGDAARELIRKMIATRRWGRPGDADKVELTEVARLGKPVEFPGA